jgi:hypothetical protein
MLSAQDLHNAFLELARWPAPRARLLTSRSTRLSTDAASNFRIATQDVDAVAESAKTQSLVWPKKFPITRLAKRLAMTAFGLT